MNGRQAVRGAVLAALYFALAWGSLALFAGFNASVSPLWPPTGLAIAALVLWGRRLWPAVTVGAFAVNLVTTGDVPSSLLIAVGNTLEAVVASELIHRHAGGRGAFDTVQGLVRFVGIVTLAAMISATVGVLSLGGLGAAPWSEAPVLWLMWWLGDMVGGIVVAPVVLLWVLKADAGWRDPGRVTEWAGAVLTTLLVVAGIFFQDRLTGVAAYPLAFLVAPGLVWIAYRFWPRDMASAILTVTVVATIATLAGSGPFGTLADPADTILLAVFEITAGVTGMALTALVVERRTSSAGLELRVRERTDALQKVVEDLRTSQERLAEAQAVAHVGSWQWDVKGDRVEWTDELYRIFGTEPKTFAATYDGYLEQVHPEDRTWVDERIRQAMVDKGAYDLEHRIRRPDGEVRWIHSQGAVETGADGEVERMYGTAQDVTERRLAEAQFRTLVDSAPDAILVADPEGAIITANRRVQEIFGYTREELTGRPIEDLIPQRFRGGHGAHRDGYMQDPQVRPMGTGLELRALRKDGTEFPVEISLSPIETERGMQVAAIVRDITEREKVAEADRVAFARLLEIEKLREVDRFKTQVLNTASHELNTPITPLKMQLFLLKGALGELNDEQRKAVEVLDRNVNRLAELVGDILDVARLQGGNLKLTPSRVEVRRLADEAVETFEEPAKAAGVVLSITGDGPTETVADAKRISQVFYNFISNALKFSPKGGRIEVSVESDGSEMLVRVEDQGPGLEAEQIARLFQPFSQVHERTPDAPAGTGLGLYICKGIIEQHRGEVGVESEGHGHGSTFWFRMPLVQSEDSLAADAS